MKTLATLLLLASAAFSQITARTFVEPDNGAWPLTSVQVFVGSSPYDGKPGCQFVVSLGGVTSNHFVSMFTGGTYQSSTAGKGDAITSPSCKLYPQFSTVAYATTPQGRFVIVTVIFEANVARVGFTQFVDRNKSPTFQPFGNPFTF